MEDLGTQFELTMAGGDTNHGQKLIINITILGEVEKESLATRDGARDGDRIMVTGRLGEAECGLSILKSGRNGSIDMIKRHTAPYPRVREAREIVSRSRITAMIDLSDGLVADLYRIVEASGVGARVYLDRLPISSALRREAEAIGLDPIELALYGGEDYELLFTTEDPSSISDIELPIAVIGEITKEKGVFLIDDGVERRLSNKGYRHF
jgi:thiamine-monophosphate kinase